MVPELLAAGISPRLRADVVLNNLVCWANTTGRIRIMSDGTPWRPVVHVQDIARAFATALVAPRGAIHDQAFNVGAAAENYQVREVAEIVRGIVAGCTIEYAAGAGPDPRSYRVDFSKLTRTFPDLQPRWNATDVFLALLRLRGMECAATERYAEGFYGRKAVLSLGTVS